MSRRTLVTAVLLGMLVACDDNSPTAENSSTPIAAEAAADAADTTGTPDAAAIKDSAAALMQLDARPASSVCARRVAELRKVRDQLGDKSVMGTWSSLRSKELMLSAVISDACY